MISQNLFYALVLLLSIPSGLLLAWLCSDEIRNWVWRLKMIAVVCVVLSVVLLFIDLTYKTSLIISVLFVAMTCLVIVKKAK